MLYKSIHAHARPRGFKNGGSGVDNQPGISENNLHFFKNSLKTWGSFEPPDPPPLKKKDGHEA